MKEYRLIEIATNAVIATWHSFSDAMCEWSWYDRKEVKVEEWFGDRLTKTYT